MGEALRLYVPDNVQEGEGVESNTKESNKDNMLVRWYQVGYYVTYVKPRPNFPIDGSSSSSSKLLKAIVFWRRSLIK